MYESIRSEGGEKGRMKYNKTFLNEGQCSISFMIEWNFALKCITLLVLIGLWNTLIHLFPLLPPMLGKSC